MKFNRSMICEPPDFGTEMHAVSAIVHIQKAEEPSVELQIKALAEQLGLSAEDLEMMQAITDNSLYSEEALGQRWAQKPQHQLSVVA